MNLSKQAEELLCALAVEPMDAWDVKRAVGFTPAAELVTHGLARYIPDSGTFYIIHTGVALVRARGWIKKKLPKPLPGSSAPAQSKCQGCQRVVLEVSLTRSEGNGLPPEGAMLCPICVLERGSPETPKVTFAKPKAPKWPRFSNRKR